MSNVPAHRSRSRRAGPAYVQIPRTLLVIGILVLSTLGITTPALAVGAAAPDAPEAFTFPLNETFKGTSASGWVRGGAAILTSGNGDPAGEGWLRLTNSSTYQAGYAYYDTAIPTGRGLVITFDYGAWGGTGADGTTFFLFDGATPTFRVGASGGSLGYAQKTGVLGLSNGYLGLGLDEFGNYSNGNEGRSGGIGATPQAVAIRGPGNGYASTDYPYLAGTTNLTKAPWSLPRIDCPKNNTVGGVYCGTGSARPSGYYRQVRIIVTPVGSAYQVTTAMKFTTSGAFQTLFGPYTMPTSAPGTLKMGFAGSTGGSTNYHEIRNLTVTPQVPDLTATKAVQNASTGGGSVAPGEQLLYTVVLKNNTSTEITGASFSDTIPTNTSYVANSASVPTGSTLAGTSPLSVTGISVPANGQAAITFKVQVVNPLPSGVTSISNQGSFTYGSGPTTSQTDGDAVTDGNQATTISVTAGPNFDTTTKTVTYADLDSNYAVSVGDRLTYHVVLSNSGNQNASPVTFSDVLPTNTTYYLAAPVTASSGTPSYTSATRTIGWTGSVNAGNPVTIDFTVTVNSGVQIRDVISNQGTVTYGTTSVLTDADLATPGKQPTQLLVGGVATLTVTKTAAVVGGGSLQPGGQVDYTITLTNPSSYTVSGATFVDTLPANTSYVSSSTTAGSATFSSGTLNVTGISLTSNASAIIHFVVQLANPPGTGVTQISNQGVVNYDSNNSGANNTSLQTDGDAATAGQQPTVTLIPNADLAVTKTVNNSNPAEGDTVVYTVRVTNNGTNEATSVVMADTLPDGLTYASSSASQGSYSNVTHNWTVGALASGASATLTLNATVDLGQGGSTLSNSATASSEIYDAYPANNTASADDLTVNRTRLTGTVTNATTGNPLSDVTVNVTGTFCTAKTESDGKYTFTSGVSGCLLAPGAATVAATDAPTGFSLASAGTTITAGTNNVRDLTLVQPSLSGVVTTKDSGVPIVGAAVEFTQGSLTCTTTTGSGGAYSFPYGTCPMVTGPSSVEATYVVDEVAKFQAVSATPSISASAPTTQNLEMSTVDLIITKSDGKVLTQLYETIEYVITVVNIGSITGSEITLVDTLPTNLTYVSASGTGWTCDDDDTHKIITCMIASLAAGASKSVTLQATVTSGTTVDNYASITTTSPENDTTNNEVTDIDTVASYPDLTISKTDGTTQVLAGGAVRYTITYRNTGNNAATGVMIVDTLLNGVEVDSSKLSGDTYSGSNPPSIYTAPTESTPGTLAWDIGPLAVNGTGSITLDLKVKSDALPSSVVADRITITNSGGGTDPNPANNTATDSDLVVAPYIVLEKSASGPAHIGQNVTYTINWRNTGEAAAKNLVIQDTLPANMTFFSADNGGTYDTPNAGKVTWSLGDQLAGASGTVSFVATVGAGAGGTAQPAPTLSTENGTGSVTVTSSTSALTLPWCTETTCAAFRDKFQDTNGEPQSGWNDNPRLTTFNDTGWTQPAASSTSEYSYWTDPDNLSAQWVAPNQNGYTYGNFTFFRQAFCLPLNATGLDATLELAGDDTSDIYLNDVYVGQEYGAGGASSFDAAAGVQSGINLLAVQLLNNRHGGHDLPGCPGCDHIGLLFNLNASYGGLRPFAAAPSTALAGQSVQFAVDTLALGGGEPYQYKFDFGDGTVIDYQSSATYSHTYSTFGVKSAIVTARDAYGCTATDTVQVTVLSSSGKMLANSVAATYTDANGKSFTGASGSASGAGTLLIDDLSIVKTVQSGGTVPGENVTYQLVVTNNGQTIVTGAVVADTVPAAVTNVTWSCVSSDGSCTTPGSGNSLSGTTTLPSGATATYTIVGTISPAATGTLANTATVTAPEGITEQDLSNNTSTASSTLVPVAANDGTYTVPYFTAYTGNVLTNDVGSLLTVSSVTGSGSPCTTFVCTVSTAHGTVYVQADGTFRYEPNRYYSGTDSFTYVAKDSYDQSTSPTTVSFNVQNPAAPVATNDSGMTETNTALSQATSILTNDTGSGITLYSVTGTGAACTGFPCSSTTAHGSAVVQSDGTYIYTPATDYKGLDSFTYVIRDDLLQSASATVNLSVTPMANNDTGMTPTNTSLDSSSPGSTQSVNNAQIVYNDIGTAIVLYSVTGAGAPCITFPCTITTAHGGAVVQSDGAYVYTPAASYTGADSFSYVIHDEFGQSSSATVSFDVQNNPLAVELASFTATLTPGGVILAWETVSEQDNAGFNLYRAASAAGPWAPLNAALIPSAAPGSGEGHSYTWLDATAGPSSPCVYRLDALDRFGVTTQLGVTTACIPPRHTWLPLITR